MGISTFVDFRDFPHKLSYSGPGFPLEKDIYPESLPADQKRSILRSIVSRERKKSDFRLFPLSKVRSRFLGIIFKKIANLTWSGNISEWEDIQRFHYLDCGNRGVTEQNAKGDSRHIVYHCNQHRRCSVCSSRYHRGRSLERSRIASSAMSANNVKYLRKFTLTFPEPVRNQITTPEQARAFCKAANKMLQSFYACPVNKHGSYIKGSVGIHIQTHWHSSNEPWRKSPHFHCYIIPLKIYKGNVTNVDFHVTGPHLDKFKKRWAEIVNQVSVKLGFQDLDALPGSLVINHRFINLPLNLENKGHPGFNFGYDQRSPADDLENSIVAVDLKDEIMVMSFTKNGYFYYAIWSFNDYVRELLTRLKLKATNSTFGWLRRFNQNAAALGIDVISEPDTFDPLPELEIKVHYRRHYHHVWDKQAKKLKEVKLLYVRKAIDPDKPEYWKLIDPWKVHGEEIWTGSKKRHAYKFQPLISTP